MLKNFRMIVVAAVAVLSLAPAVARAQEAPCCKAAKTMASAAPALPAHRMATRGNTQARAVKTVPVASVKIAAKSVAPAATKSAASVPACCKGGNCCANGVCCAMPGCCKTDKSCCDPTTGACTSACGCLSGGCRAATK